MWCDIFQNPLDEAAQWQRSDALNHHLGGDESKHYVIREAQQDADNDLRE
jgi:hypothetical protein